MENKQETLVNLGTTGKIVLPKFNASQYIGQKVTIVSADTYKGDFGYYVKFTTSKLDDRYEVTRNVGLQEDEEGNVGWGVDTIMDKLLTKYGVQHFTEMIGKEVVVQVKQGKEGKEFLTFI